MIADKHIFVAVNLVTLRCLHLHAGDGFHFGRVEGFVSHCAGGVGPHKEEGYPAEELHKAHRPERVRGMDKQFDEVALLFGFAGSVITLRRPFFYLGHGIEHAEDEHCGSYVERPNHRRRNHAFGCYRLDTDPCEDEGKDEAYYGTGVAKKALYGVCFCFLLVVYHIAHKHLEGLHGHVDARVEKHQSNQAYQDSA